MIIIFRILRLKLADRCCMVIVIVTILRRCDCGGGLGKKIRWHRSGWQRNRVVWRFSTVKAGAGSSHTVYLCWAVDVYSAGVDWADTGFVCSSKRVRDLDNCFGDGWVGVLSDCFCDVDLCSED